MKLALLSDIHSNRQALDACLQHARAHGADHFALLGDLVGYGADPAYVVQQALALVDAAHQVCPYSNATRGNIDVTITLV